MPKICEEKVAEQFDVQEKELVSQYSFLGHVLAKRSAQGLKNGAIASGEPWDAKEWEDFLTG